ncbi:MAG: phosphoglycerate mutase, partial [Acidimicrobiaceae bacterium]|nr:phosphoglycerate mutase [Acidimicrobiaceae bacterium]MYK74344.1 phosphoglycerate mutase [Acidimicrobiaceae bacterium]
MATSSARTSANPASKAGAEAAAVVLFVRHGQTPTTGAVLPGRAPGLHLSSEGVEQAQRVAERLAGLGRIKAVYASPMERTVETAGPIARAC